MPKTRKLEPGIYEGRREGTLRVIVHDSKSKRNVERVVEGGLAEARLVKAQLRVELRVKALESIQRAPTFSAFCIEKYEPHAKATLKASTWKRGRRYQVADLVKFFGTTRLDRLTLELVDAYKVHCANRDWAPRYTNAHLVALMSILSLARKRNLPVAHVRVELIDPGKSYVRAWSLDEVRKLYEAAQKCSPWFVSVLHFLFDTGVRKGEAIAARWSWVDFERRRLHIPRNEFWQPKDKDERFVPLSDALFQMLWSMPRDGSSNGNVFVNQFGVPYAYFPDQTFWKVQELAGVEGHVHMTRHTFASHFLQSQPDMALLAEVMGHTSTHVTEMYTHLLPSHLERARNAVQLAPPGTNWAATARRVQGDTGPENYSWSARARRARGARDFG